MAPYVAQVTVTVCCVGNCPPSTLKAGVATVCACADDEQRLSLAFSTDESGKLFLIGTKPVERLSVSIFKRTFERCMGLCAAPDAQTLWMSSLSLLWRFENALSGTCMPRAFFKTGEIHRTIATKEE